MLFVLQMELITSKGYPAELHNATTSDGYILGIHRIPHGRSGNSTVNSTGMSKSVLAVNSTIINLQVVLWCFYSMV